MNEQINAQYKYLNEYMYEKHQGTEKRLRSSYE